MSNKPTRIQPAYIQAIEDKPQEQAVKPVQLAKMRSRQEMGDESTRLLEIKTDLMREGEHYMHYEIGGRSAGKPSLLLPGAQMIASTLNFSVSYEDSQVAMPANVIFVRKRCILTGGALGDRRIEGVGTANSKEKSNWERQPYANANIIEKIACKRAFVAAVLTAASGAQIFTQDLEDMPDARPANSDGQRYTPGPPPARESDAEGRARLQAEWESASAHMPPELREKAQAILDEAKGMPGYSQLLQKYILRAKDKYQNDAAE